MSLTAKDIIHAGALDTGGYLRVLAGTNGEKVTLNKKHQDRM